MAPHTADAVVSAPMNQAASSGQEQASLISVSRNSIEVENDNGTSIDSALTSASESDNDEELWTTVGPRRSRSFNNLTDLNSSKPAKLTKEQSAIIQAAEKLLTPAQRTLVCKRNSLVRQGRSHSPKAGPSSYVAKGKFADRNNKVSDSELNIEAQKAVLENWNAIGKASKPVNESQEDNSDHSDREDKKNHKKSGSSKRKEHLRKHKKARIEAEYSSDSESESEPVPKKDYKHAANGSKVALRKMLKPMSSTYARQLQKVVKGRTPTPAAQRSDKGYTKPINQGCQSQL